ncbi:MAG: TRAP transporter large permease [Planctomycetota bacterium]|jgi:tripartite ATP-independent transporter DctM subunit|nr:TRAP transporter large permease [Planctomycetota bacterium]
MNSDSLPIYILLGGFAVLMTLRVPITFCLLSATLMSAVANGTNLSVMVRQLIDGVNNFSLLAIPFFILMGEFMGAGGISDKIIDFTNLVIGRFRGGLAYVNVFSSMLFGGISGSAVADVSSMGPVVIPMMVKQGYDREFSVGLTVTTACQGVLIPPSHNMVIYALAAGGVSIGSLLMAGLFPGMLLGGSFALMCWLLAGHYHFPKGVAVPRDQWARIIIHAILPLLTLAIIMVGTGAGVFTATESSAIACVYVFILSYLVFRNARLREIGKTLRNALRTLAIVMALIACAKAFSYMMTELRVPEMVTMLLLSITENRVLLILIINLMLLILGCFMDMAPLIMIMTPILLPIVTGPVIGMHPIHFGIMLIFNLAVGLCTPPVGSALFVGCAVGKTAIEGTTKKMFPLFLTMVFALMLVTFVPAISMWLPNALFGN